MTVTLRGARRLLPVLALVWLLRPAAATAHAELRATVPEAGATVEAPLGEVVAAFSEALAARSSIEVLAPDGSVVARGGPQAEDPTRLGAQLPPGLAPGGYEVRWQAFSQDGHLERGTFRFTLAAATPRPPTPPLTSGGPSVAPSPPAGSTSRPTPSPSADPVPSPAAGADVAIPIAVALAALVALGSLLVRRARGRA